MRTKIIWLGAGIVAIFALFLLIRGIWLDQSGESDISGGKVRVTASFYPLAEFARQVGKDKVEVTTLVSPGIEPHDYDPTPREIAGIYKSKLFIFNGAGLEPWADKIKGELESTGIVVVDASDGIGLINKNESTGETDTSGDTYSSYDPHFWLDPVLASREVDNIKDGLVAANPENRESYEANAQAYKEQLSQLDRSFRDGLANCTGREIVTSHQAFNYLANRYNLSVMAISCLSPE
jgi:zinc transport system substrate-binding protein